MKLISEKCAFGVESGKFLGFLVSQMGIEANLKKVEVIPKMRSPKDLKDVQSLAGKVTALSRFILKSSEKCHPFFELMKKGKRLRWLEECETTFQQLKAYLANVPTLAKPLVGDVLLIYLVVLNYSTSSVMVKEEDEVQQLVYYMSRSLTGAKVRYPIAEKWPMVFVVATRKLRPYFQAHEIVVVTNQHLRSIFQK